MSSDHEKVVRLLEDCLELGSKQKYTGVVVILTGENISPDVAVQLTVPYAEALTYLERAERHLTQTEIATTSRPSTRG